MLRAVFVSPLLIVLIALAGANASAELIQLQLTGLNISYSKDTGLLVDSASANYRTGNPADADPLIGTAIVYNGVLHTQYAADVVSADLYIPGVNNIPADGGAVTSSAGGGMDLLFADGSTLLKLTLDQVRVYYSGYQLFIAAGGNVTTIDGQNLPPSLVMQHPVSVAIISTTFSSFAVDGSGQYVQSFDASGVGDIRGVPEPASLLALLCAATISGAVALFRRRL